MNRIDRLLAIVLQLQAKHRQRAEDLAATFEVSKRTIYRDMLALAESGVPLISEPGKGYSLVEGYFLPPLSFSTDEALMLLIGSDFAAQNFDAQYHSAALTANRKISAVLPAKLQADVADLQRSIRFITPTKHGAPEFLRTLQQVRRAIIQRQTVRFSYQARFNTDSPSVRDADPYALVHVAEVWYMVAYCHVRHDIRNFRLNRIVQLRVLDQTFVRPTNFEIKDGDPTDRMLMIQALFDAETARWVQESPSYYQTAAEDRGDGWLVTLHVRHEDEILQWLLGWGAHVQVLAPDSLRTRIAQQAQATLSLYAEKVVENEF